MVLTYMYVPTCNEQKNSNSHFYFQKNLISLKESATLLKRTNTDKIAFKEDNTLNRIHNRFFTFCIISTKFNCRNLVLKG